MSLQDDLKNGEYIATCPSCSLNIRLVLEEVLFFVVAV